MADPIYFNLRSWTELVGRDGAEVIRQLIERVGGDQAITKNLVTVVNDVDVFQTDTTAIESNIDDVEEDVAALQTSVAELQEGVETIPADDITDLLSSMTMLLSELKRLSHRVNELENLH